MKKYYIFILLIFFLKEGFCQFPSNQSTGTNNTLFTHIGAQTASIGGILTNYTDTTSANLALWLKGVSGAEIFTTSDNFHWIRNASKTAWIKQTSGSVPAQFNPIAGTGMSITGTYPNMTFSNTSIGSQTLQQVFAQQSNTAVMTGNNTINNGTHLFSELFTSPTISGQTISILQNNGTGDYNYQIGARDVSTLGNPTSFMEVAPNKGVTIDNANDAIAGGIHKNVVVNKDSITIGGFCDACPRVTAIRVDGNDAGNVKFPNVQRVTGAQHVMLVADSTNRNNVGYMTVPTAVPSWLLTGNAGTTAGTNFIGTTDNVDLVLKRNNFLAGRISTSNTSYGVVSLNSITSGTENAAFGYEALFANEIGEENTAIGINSLLNSDVGNSNTAIGHSALVSNQSGSNNVGVGTFADVAFSNLQNATAIGDHSFVSQSNSMVLGSINGINSASADTKVGIGTTAPTEALHVANNFRLQGAFMPNNSAGIAGQRLKSQGVGLPPIWADTTIASTVTPAALTKTDDTNVTLTLGGTPSTALLQSTSITVGWTGPLAATRGGTGQTTIATGDILYGSATNTISKLGIGTTGQKLTVVGGVPAWRDTIPAFDTTAIYNNLYGKSPFTGIYPKGKKIAFAGDSYLDPAGVGPSTHAKSLVGLVCSASGATEYNFAVAGTTAEKRSPQDYMAAPNSVDDTVNIPFNNADEYALYIVDFMLNDAGQLAPNYTVANYKTDYAKHLACAKRRGHHVLVLGGFYINATGKARYNTITGNGVPTDARLDSFSIAAKQLADSLGLYYINTRALQILYSDTLMNADGIHPTDYTSARFAYWIMQYLNITPTSTATFSGIIPTANNVVFQHVTNIAATGTIWNATTTGVYGHTGLSDTTFVGDRRIIMSGSSYGAFYGFNSANAQAGYLSMEAAILLSGTDLYVVDNNSFIGPVATISNSDLMSISRTGSTFKVQTSSDGGLSWPHDKYTYTYTSSATMYIVTDIGGITDVNGHLDNPKISDLSAGGYIDMPGAIPYSNGFALVYDANKHFIDLTTGNVGIGKTTPSEKLDVVGNVRFSGALMPNNSAGTSGQVLTSSGTSSPPTWATNSLVMNGLLGATAINSINNGNFVQEYAWNSISNGRGLSLISSSTAAASNTQTLFNATVQGVNANSSQTTYSAQISNNHGGTGAVNVAAKFSSTTGANNYAIIVPLGEGSVGIGNSAPTEVLDVTGNIKLSAYFETIPDYQTPATGATITTIKTSTIIDPAGTLATLTINLPSSPLDGMIVAYSFSQIITALTFANGTLANPITASAAGGTVKFIYSTTGAKWYKWQ